MRGLVPTAHPAGTVPTLPLFTRRVWVFPLLFRARHQKGRSMAEGLFFHHVLGRAAGFLALADTIREAGHTVHPPDMFGGATFDSIEAGMDHTRTAGHDPVGVGLRAAEALPADP